MSQWVLDLWCYHFDYASIFSWSTFRFDCHYNADSGTTKEIYSLTQCWSIAQNFVNSSCSHHRTLKQQGSWATGNDSWGRPATTLHNTEISTVRKDHRYSMIFSVRTHKHTSQPKTCAKCSNTNILELKFGVTRLVDQQDWMQRNMAEQGSR
jgi:hypothetical protein